MIKTILEFADNTTISSGINQQNAIQSASIEENVNDSQDLTFGSTCAKMIDVKIITPNNNFVFNAGEEIVVYNEYENGTREKQGHFILQEPAKIGANTTKVIAYDKIVLLDKDLTVWLSSLDEFPYSLFRLAQMVCNQCGLELANANIPNGSYAVQMFGSGSITGRQIIRWIGEVAGCYCVANQDGEIEYKWYSENFVPIRAERQEDSIMYLGNGLSYEDYETAKIDRVQIRQNANDKGVIYPLEGEAENVYIIESNPLMSHLNGEYLPIIAQYLYEKIKDVSYRPCKVRVIASNTYKAGDIINITDVNGISMSAYVMSKKRTGQTEELECTGNYKRNGPASLYSTSYKAAAGKSFSIQTDIEGLKTQVKDLEEGMTSIEQTAGAVKVTASNEKGTLQTTISNDGTWVAEYTDSNANVISGLYFDFEAEQFVFDGTGKFKGSLDIGDGNFVVTETGDLTSKGNASLYGAKIRALKGGGYAQMSAEGIDIYNDTGVKLITLGYPENKNNYPFLLLRSLESGVSGLVKKFSNGMWIGNSAPKDATGSFSAQSGYQGLFISFEDGSTYVVSGETMQNVYIGEAVARFA